MDISIRESDSFI